MIKIDEATIKSRINGSPSGIRAVFVPLDNKWAIKLFEYEDDRDRAYRNQKLAAEYGLGPDVGETVDFRINCDFPYGYITEIVETCVPHEEIINRTGITIALLIEDKVHQERVKELRYKLFDCTGIDYGYDMHSGNIGIKNGQYVLIDFGQEDRY